MNNFIKFNYLYRDGGNYKSWGEVIFTNPNHLTLQEIDKCLRLAFDQEIFFIASQVSIPEVFLYGNTSLNEDDHCFHEYDSVELINELLSSFPQKSISQFLEQVKHISKSGWQAFNPIDEITHIRQRAFYEKDKHIT